MERNDKGDFYLVPKVFEIQIIQAAFREEVYRKAEQGTPSSISNYDAIIADGDIKKEPVRIPIPKPAEFVRLLEEFHNNTEDAIMEIPQITNIPAFANNEIPNRINLGRGALTLAVDFKSALEKFDSWVDLKDIDADLAAKELMDDLDNL